MVEDGSPNGFKLVSTVFREGSQIPLPYTCRGQGVSPPLNIINTPEEAKSLALIMHDPDAVSGDFLHWMVWDIPAGTDNLAANSVPVGAISGYNGKGQLGYCPPCPPNGTGTHRYIFELYALDSTLNLPKETSLEQLRAAMQEHILAEDSITGLFTAES